MFPTREAESEKFPRQVYRAQNMLVLTVPVSKSASKLMYMPFFVGESCKGTCKEGCKILARFEAHHTSKVTSDQFEASGRSNYKALRATPLNQSHAQTILVVELSGKYCSNENGRKAMSVACRLAKNHQASCKRGGTASGVAAVKDQLESNEVKWFHSRRSAHGHRHRVRRGAVSSVSSVPKEADKQTIVARQAKLSLHQHHLAPMQLGRWHEWALRWKDSSIR